MLYWYSWYHSFLKINITLSIFSSSNFSEALLMQSMLTGFHPTDLKSLRSATDHTSQHCKRMNTGTRRESRKKCHLRFPIQMIRFELAFLKTCTLLSSAWGIGVKHEIGVFPTLRYNFLSLCQRILMDENLRDCISQGNPRRDQVLQRVCKILLWIMTADDSLWPLTVMGRQYSDLTADVY